ncbi:MAG: FAD:protein FMN transferase, partial [Lachnospiraceae bacterium]|nr:FAD:protein FMN transferase [Lachnospiraceae bacterium]
MKQKIFNRTGRATALLMAAIIAMTGCDYSLRGNESSGTVQTDESTAESAKEQDSAGKQAAGEPVVRELYDVMTVPYMRLQAYGDNADAALALGVEKIESLDALLSTGNPESEIGKLNAYGSAKLGGDASYLLKASLDLYQQTDGAFDVSVYPLMELWGFTNLFD